MMPRTHTSKPIIPPEQRAAYEKCMERFHDILARAILRIWREDAERARGAE